MVVMVVEVLVVSGGQVAVDEEAEETVLSNL